MPAKKRTKTPIHPALLLVAHHSVFAGARPSAAEVVSVYDGDTITVEANGTRFKCRLLGIDTRELSYARLWTEMDKVSKYAPLEPRRELHEAQQVYRRRARVMAQHGRQARDTLAGLVRGKVVRLADDTKEPTRDQCRRVLVYVSVDGKDVSAELIKRGLAVADTHFGCDRLTHCAKL